MNDRRQRLLERIAAQRELLAHQAVPLRQATYKLDRSLRTVQYLKRNPLLTMGGGALALMLLRGYARSSWMHYGWQAWQLLRQLRR
jgi:hypothetical protein